MTLNKLIKDTKDIPILKRLAGRGWSLDTLVTFVLPSSVSSSVSTSTSLSVSSASDELGGVEAWVRGAVSNRYVHPWVSIEDIPLRFPAGREWGTIGAVSGANQALRMF